MSRKEFTAESGLGFMRFVQFINVLSIFLQIVSLALMSTNQINNLPIFTTYTTLVSILGQAALMWMLARRKMYTRQYAMVYYVLATINMFIYRYFFMGADLLNSLLTAVVPLLLIIYFATSRRAKAVLVRPFAHDLRNKALAEGRKMYNPKSLDFWLRLLIYFFVFSVVGHWMEMGVQVLVVHGIFPGTVAEPDSLTWKDHFGPFCIYGIAFAICGLALYPIYMKMREKFPHDWQAFVGSYLVNALFCALAELVLGMLFNTDYSAWDYRDQFLNYKGQVCLLYTVCFGVMSSLIVWVVYPFLERQFSYVGKDAFRVIFVISAVLFVLLIAAYNIDPLKTFGFNPDTIDTSNISDRVASTQ